MYRLTAVLTDSETGEDTRKQIALEITREGDNQVVRQMEVTEPITIDL